MYFNRKYKTVGHLFQGRFKAILCDKDSYLLSLIKYIHMNPVRTKMAKAIGDYGGAAMGVMSRRKKTI
jgi:putative transposase